MDRRDNQDVKGDAPRDDIRSLWAKPELKRLTAGSAEASDGVVDDGFFNPS